jgi:opacity protein-like surface antigen
MRKSLLCSLVAASILVASSAFADHHMADSSIAPGWYVGAGVNRSSLETMDVTTTVGGGDSTTVQIDSRHYGWSVLAGKNITKLFAVEAQYTKFGNNTVNDDAENLSVNVTDTYSYGFTGVLKSPSWNGFSFLAKGGVAYLSEKSDATIASSGVEQTTAYNGAGLTYGVGAQYDYNQFGVRFDWSAMDVNDSEEVNSYVFAPETYTLSVLYNFA